MAHLRLWHIDNLKSPDSARLVEKVPNVHDKGNKLPLLHFPVCRWYGNLKLSMLNAAKRLHFSLKLRKGYLDMRFKVS